MANLESGLGYICLDTAETWNVPERQNGTTGACSTSIRTTHHMQNLLQNLCNFNPGAFSCSAFKALCSTSLPRENIST
jgi:hypothetical protein